MMKTIQLGRFTFDYNDQLISFCDADEGRLAFISKNYDEIHLIIVLQDDCLTFHPRWNVNIQTLKGTSTRYRIDINFPNDQLNLDDCPMT